MNSSTKKYYKNIRLLLPAFGKNEKKLLNSITIRLKELDFIDSNVTYDEICKELGTPQEIVSEYIFSLETDKIIKNLSFIRYIRKFFIILVIILLLLSGIRIRYLNMAFEELKNDIVTYEHVTIE